MILKEYLAALTIAILAILVLNVTTDIISSLLNAIFFVVLIITMLYVLRSAVLKLTQGPAPLYRYKGQIVELIKTEGNMARIRYPDTNKEVYVKISELGS